MTEHNVGLDGAQDALRAWCHDRPDIQDPSIVYEVFGAITAIIATLEHIIDVASRSAARASGTDDARAVAHAGEEIDRHARAGIMSLDEAYRAIARAHEITGHLIFAMDNEVAPTNDTRLDVT